MPSIYETVKPAPVRRCPVPAHTKHFPGCPECRSRSVYLRALAIWETANGIDHSYVPAEQARQHIKFLINEGHRTVIEIADESGVTDRTIFQIISGCRTKLFPLTARSLLAIEPAAADNPPKRTLVPAIEGARLLQGLFAQGWKGQHIGDMLGLSRSAAQAFAKGNREWMETRTRDRIRQVAKKIGHLDISQLPQPLPGMDPRSANAAADNGWRKLSYWKDFNITKKDPEPYLRDSELTEEDTDLVDVAFIDALIIKKINDIAVRIRLGQRDETGRSSDLFIPKLESLRQLELHAAWWYADQAGLNDTHIGSLLGYDMSKEDSRTFNAGQRHVNRVQVRTTKARNWIHDHTPGNTPGWFTKPPNEGRTTIENLLPALIALQPAPFGADLTVEQLADTCGVTTTAMAEFVAVATRKGDTPWNRQHHKTHTHRCSSCCSKLAPAQAAA